AWKNTQWSQLAPRVSVVRTSWAARRAGAGRAVRRTAAIGAASASARTGFVGEREQLGREPLALVGAQHGELEDVAEVETVEREADDRREREVRTGAAQALEMLADLAPRPLEQARGIRRRGEERARHGRGVQVVAAH